MLSSTAGSSNNLQSSPTFQGSARLTQCTTRRKLEAANGRFCQHSQTIGTACIVEFCSGGGREKVVSADGPPRGGREERTRRWPCRSIRAGYGRGALRYNGQ